MSTFTLIQDTLQTFVVETLASANIRVQGENTRGAAQIGEAWAQCTLLPATTQLLELGGGRATYSGLFHINLFFPAQSGTNANEVVDLLVDAVKEQHLIDVGDFSVHLVTVSRQPARTETDWYQVPVRIEWRAYA